MHPCQQQRCTSLVDERKPPKKIQQTHIDLLIYMGVILVRYSYINSVDYVSGCMAI
ncbi:UvrABC system protein A-Excinuclease ABC subunit A [Moritella viscosa]|uniref:UvrABC system protein A-Excinuclease ABC subunit A n=1 Tax=Moritella viscosa TaxID=80854 RepID=A0ABY1HAQ4_9GAMM|nr:UvrABC system protein A-Excinuclease ABC subunit A [Moritella viscosa]SGY88167.1 UvrABC system protein A-Excinuclease ABC subunit A [Moritella viscosa]SGY90541.1 UvrABC system protein A-Excinuclease ABC subunit A [Moritella viscosa]SHO00949.1 UvrABC system protein A-Excinuclease ABC subunit A [Moritella viscosa]SHO01274.1 UvrABC system protein A-Excinuclease ABC subunit A [Moritella viscosa]